MRLPAHYSLFKRVLRMVAKIKTLWNGRRWTVIAVAAAVVVASGGFAAVRLANPAVKVPTGEVKRGDFVDSLQLRGETKALKSVTISAPFRAGQLQIIKLAKNGSQVKKGDVVVQFDVTKLQQDLAQNRSLLRSAEAEIEQTRAQTRLMEEQDVTDLMKARYDLEAAKLDASKQEIVSKIEGEKAKLTVEDDEQKVLQDEQKLKSDRAGAAADIEAKKQKREKALYDVQQSERAVSVLTLKAPIDGMVQLMRNWRAGGFFGGAPEFKEGDRAWPGAPMVELPDLTSLRVGARVEEIDRGKLKTDQPVTLRVDAVPDREFAGRVARISTLTSMDFAAGWPFPRNFDVEIELAQSDARLKPGMRATLRVAVDRLPNSVLIPTEASFQKLGRTVAYVQRGAKFEERAIDVSRRGEGQLLIASGLTPGERVALKDPTEKQ